MSPQHDYDIGNANGASFRADINNALSAVQSINSGTSAPSSTVAYMLWADTTNGLLKVRNGANNAWISLGAIDTANLGLATLGSPSFTGTLTSAGDIVCSGTGSLQLPVGTTGQRPGSPSTGDTRFNSSLSQVETYSGSTWEKVGGLPAGSVVSYAHSTVPSGWLECNGSAYSRSTYATLYSAIGTLWGTGNGSTTFNIPNLQGEFIRGWDNSRGVDSGRNIATSQSDQNKQHNHDANVSDSGHTHQGRGLTLNNVFGGVGITLGSGQGYQVGYRNDNVNFSNANTTNQTGISVSTDNQGGTEVRVRNISMMYIIKY